MRNNQTIKNIESMLQSVCIGDVIHIEKRELDMILNIIYLLNYHLPAAVTEYVAYLSGADDTYHDYELCPKCGGVIERTYQEHCDRCGQRLRWISKKRMRWRK